MKFTLIAGLALSVQARRFNPKRTPEEMLGQHRPRFILDENDKPLGSDALKYQELADAGTDTGYCLKEARMFDAYCHQYKAKEGKAPRYADYTEAEDNRECGQWTDDESAAHCLAQDCMFDYCLWRRDEWVEDCEAAVENGTQMPSRPGWGQVYSYGNMHNDLLAGDFTSDTCTEYYEVKEDY